MMRYVPIGFQKPHWRRSKYVTSQKALIRFRSLSCLARTMVAMPKKMAYLFTVRTQSSRTIWSLFQSIWNGETLSWHIKNIVMIGKKRSRKNTVRFDMEVEPRQKNQQNSDKLLRVADVAKIMQRSESSIYKRLEKKLIPGHKDGNCWFVFESELLDYVKSK